MAASFYLNTNRKPAFLDGREDPVMDRSGQGLFLAPC